MSTNFLDVLNITGPVCLIALFGYWAVATDRFPKSAVGGLGIFVINYAVPFALFRAVATNDLEKITNVGFLWGFAAATVLVFAIGFLQTLWGAKRGLVSATLTGMGSSMSNAMMVGYPIIILIFGEAGMLAIVLQILVQDIIIMPLTLALCEIGSSNEAKLSQIIKNTLLKLITNPIILAIFFGLLVTFFSIPIPKPLMQVVNLMASCAAGLGLFTIGALLVGVPMKGLLSRVVPIIAFKLLVHPALVFAIFYFIPSISPMLKTAGVITASLPMVGMYPAFAHRYGQGANAAASALPTTVLSFFSMTGIIWALMTYQPFGPL
ncbi:MAG: malonate transporter [Paraglaciecola sp.]|jgi:malonate transporter